MLRTLNPGESNLRKGQWLLAPLIISAGIIGFSLPLASQHSPPRADSSPQIKIAVNLVLLPVNVADARGSFVPGLNRDDFRVLEDGQPQKITVFEEGDTPVTVGLVVDHSKSMGSKLPGVATAVLSFAHSSNPQDEMFVVDFNDDVSIELMGGKSFSNNASDLEPALSAVTARGQTALYDAVSEGLIHLQSGHQAKKALIIISDGGDNASHLKYSQVLAQARQSQVAIYSILLLSASGDEEENPGILRSLCKDTGGIAYIPGPRESIADASKAIARDLREQYTIGYVSMQSGDASSYRKIVVKVDAPGHGRLHVRTRPGYSPAAVKPPVAQPVSLNPLHQ